VLDNAGHQGLKVGMSGFIALQLHNRDELKMDFKDLFLRKL
jgi:hypothetical protein